MPFETRPFNLGNTLMQAAQLESARKRNSLVDAQINALNTRTDQQNALNAALADGATPEQLARMPGGMSAASNLQNLNERQFSELVRRGQFTHRAALMVSQSADPVQAAQLLAKDPQFTQIFPQGLRLEGLDAEAIRSQANQIAARTAMFNDPNRLSSMQRGRSLVVQGDDGSNSFATEVFDPTTGKTRVETTAIPGVPTNQSGETPDEVSLRKAHEQRSSEQIKRQELERKEIRESARKARGAVSQVRRFRQLSKDVSTGMFATSEASLRKFGLGIGLSVDEAKLAAAEGLQALAVPFTLQIAQQTKGPISDREMALFASAVPGLSRSPGGNEIILEFMERSAQRAIDIDRLASEWVQQGGSMNEQWIEELTRWETENPLFDQGEIDALSNAAFSEGVVGTETGGVIDLGGGATLEQIK